MNTLETVLHIQDLLFSFPKDSNSLPIIDRITCVFKSGEVTVLLGPSGCGKTTLLNLIAKILTPHSGTITYLNSGSETGYSVGYVFQTPSLIPWLTIKDNALFGSDVMGNLTDATRSKCDNLFRIYGLTDFQDSYPNALSGGMRQRVSMVRAALSGAKIMLLDEPFAHSDFLMRHALQRELSRLVVDEGLIAILVTHDIEEAIRIGDKVVILSERPAQIKFAMEIPISRDERLLNKSAVINDIAPYIELAWKAFEKDST